MGKSVNNAILFLIAVCDVYQEWCGPCKAMVSKFKTIKNEIGDDLLHFAIVCYTLLCYYH